MYRVASDTSIDVAIGYQYLGEASLGTRIVHSGASSNGDIKQTLHSINARIGLVNRYSLINGHVFAIFLNFTSAA